MNGDDDRDVSAYRIKGEDTSYWSVCLGLVAVIVLGSAIYYVSSYRSEHKKVARYDFNSPVPSDAELKARLKEEQYRVTRENGTEPAFQNDYWNSEKPGLYVDVITGDPLFSSTDKFDARNGRPNFTKPLPTAKLTLTKDTSRPELDRVDVRTTRSNSHLGYLFHDGPPPANDRYVVNSAALKFIPADKLEEEGYGQWKSLFSNASPGPSASR
ncbi:MAG: peptide-methionine (R)-S-oxide reductase MsrB [Chthoniobacterales bacterium]|jgi:methionine-R-sulfoxide reductase